jgi:hypothetical protein
MIAEYAKGRKRPNIFALEIITIPTLKVWAKENLNIMGLT